MSAQRENANIGIRMLKGFLYSKGDRVRELAVKRATILDKTIDYTLIICSTCAYLMKKHQNTPLNLPPRPQNNVESVRNENNKTTLIGGGMGEVCSM